MRPSCSVLQIKKLCTGLYYKKSLCYKINHIIYIQQEQQRSGCYDHSFKIFSFTVNTQRKQHKKFNAS